MRAWIFAAVAALSFGQAEAATINGEYISRASGGPTTIIIDQFDDWQTLFISVTSPDRFSGIEIAFKPLSGSGVFLSSNGGTVFSYPGWTGTVVSFSSLPPETATWSIASTESLFPHFSRGLWFQACFLGNSECSGGKIVFDQSDRAQASIEISGLDLAAIPVPASAFLLIGALAGLGTLRRVRAAGSRSTT